MLISNTAGSRPAGREHHDPADPRAPDAREQRGRDHGRLRDERRGLQRVHRGLHRPGGRGWYRGEGRHFNRFRLISTY